MGAPHIHEKYAKEILRAAFGDKFLAAPKYEFGPGAGGAKIDGLLFRDIALEIESRASKQVRGALVDLALHPRPRKLLLVMKVHGDDLTPRQATCILEAICPAGTCFMVVPLTGNGTTLSKKTIKITTMKSDIRLVRRKVRELRSKHIA